jgi:cellulose synthase/poly-beta-1,6-N-acetylglucosamine synthase-like glycosyltransferase
MILTVLDILLLITSVLTLVYAATTSAFIVGWLSYRVEDTQGESPGVSVIVAARNESANIISCLEHLVKQDYPESLSEIMVVDDNSTDDTVVKVLEFISSHPGVRLLQLAGSGLQGKKQALSMGIKNCRHDIIQATDADCEMGSGWLRSMMAGFARPEVMMVTGPLVFMHDKGFFKKLQSLELLAIMGATAGALRFDRAIMCNGANLAYRKSAFVATGGYGADEGASGDDVLLMYRVKRMFPGSIRFLKNKEAIVRTRPAADLATFLEQRKRWASKAFSSLNAETKFVSLLVFSLSFFLLLSGAVAGLATLKSGVCQPFFGICLILTGIKCFFDFLLLFLAASFFDRKHCLYFFLPGQIIYIFYVVVVGMLGNRGKYEWKGRRINH